MKLVTDLLQEKGKWSIKRLLVVLFSIYTIRIVEALLPLEDITEGASYVLFIIVGLIGALLGLTVAVKHNAFSKKEETNLEDLP